MTRCLSEKAIFNHLDGRLGEKAVNRIKTHMISCTSCKHKVNVIKTLRASAIEHLTVSEPDWTKLDPAIEEFIWRETEPARPVFSWIPVALTAAAAALFVLAFLPEHFVLNKLTHTETQPDTVASNASEAKPAMPNLLEAFIVENLDSTDRLHVEGQRIFSGEPLNTQILGGIRLAIDSDTIIEVGEDTVFEIASLDIFEPSVELRSGLFLARVPEGHANRELIVMAGKAVFSVLSGSAEFYVKDDHVAVRVFYGEVSQQSGTKKTMLAPGSWMLASQKNGEPEWIAAAFPKYRQIDSRIGIGEVFERKLSSKATGTLSRMVVRESLIRMKPQLKRCYESALKREPLINTFVEAKVSVNHKGEISKVKMTGADEWPKLEECLIGVFEQMSFPTPSGGGVELIFPLHLSPQL